ncbi:hypothetical protein QJS10_CPA07g00475 [Acorus calamus]|uniref:Reverse transcriptase domain-containing protein n=1 Tax=Acorus calamus TaxID=4465 RepID=A0AAV9EGD7_ACOCL|nr:hypothetical protein QJS10_CPA07g00475 [Acorus calamus]
MHTFSTWIEDKGLLYLPIPNHKYTWSKLRDNPSMAILDRVLVDEEWEAEILKALKGAEGDKAPSLDGFGLVFYKHFWHIVKEDVMSMFEEFFLGEQSVGVLNASHFVLIPKKEGQRKGLLFKLDFAKAYDNVDREFLLQLLEVLGFPTRWVRMVRQCVNIVHASLVINGEVSGFFPLNKGLQ